MTVKGNELKPGMFVGNALIIEVNKDYVEYLSLSPGGDKTHRSSFDLFTFTDIEVFKPNYIRRRKAIRMAFR